MTTSPMLPGQATSDVVSGKGSKRRSRRVKIDKSLLLLAVPGVIFFAIFSYLPMAGIVIAFKDFNIRKGIFGSDWNGFENFRFFFESGDAVRIIFNTIFLNVLFIGASTITAVALAVMLNEIRLKLFKRVLQSTIFLPYFISPVIVSLMLASVLQGIGGQSGMLNDFLGGIGMAPVNWYGRAELWPTILTIVKVWQTAGYLSIIYLAVIASIGDDVYEAARLDGASSARMAWSITIPLLKPTILLMLLISVGRIFYGDFGTIYAIIGDNGALLPTTDVIDTYVFRSLRTLGNFGMTAAVGLFQSVVGFALVAGALLLTRYLSREKKA